MAKPLRLKRVVIKEELVELTGDWLSALILNQLLYWSERVGDFDKFLEEERQANEHAQKVEKRHGWIYKTANELTGELMNCASSRTVRQRLKGLIEKGWIEERNNPKHKWDRTLQYRVNRPKLHADLIAIGYALDGYSIPHVEKVTVRSDTTSHRSAESSPALPETTPETTTPIPPTAGDVAPTPPKKRKTKTPIPAAVKAFRSNAHRFPAKSWWGDVATAVGEKEADLAFWGKVVKTWVGYGWNPTNVKGMLECFRDRRIPVIRGRNNGRVTTTERVEKARGVGGPVTDELLAEFGLLDD